MCEWLANWPQDSLAYFGTVSNPWPQSTLDIGVGINGFLRFLDRICNSWTNDLSKSQTTLIYAAQILAEQSHRSQTAMAG
jgi:hypothetical protein